MATRPNEIVPEPRERTPGDEGGERREGGAAMGRVLLGTVGKQASCHMKKSRPATPRRGKESGSSGRRGSAPLPEFVAPQLATLVSEAPTGDAWLHESKFDGYRILARLDHGRVRLL